MGRLQPARRGVRTSQASVLRILLRESVRWRDRVCAHANSDFTLEAAAGILPEHGHSPKKRAVPLAQCASIGHEPTLTSTEGRAHVARAHAAPPPEGERAVARSHVRTRELRLLFGGRGWHVGARPCTEGEEGPLAGAVSFHRSRTGSKQRGAARARRKRVSCASSRERERAQWRFFLRTCARKLLIGGHGWHIGARPSTE